MMVRVGGSMIHQMAAISCPLSCNSISSQTTTHQHELLLVTGPVSCCMELQFYTSFQLSKSASRHIPPLIYKAIFSNISQIKYEWSNQSWLNRTSVTAVLPTNIQSLIHSITQLAIPLLVTDESVNWLIWHSTTFTGFKEANHFKNPLKNHLITHLAML